jgi:hypothetical protein
VAGGVQFEMRSDWKQQLTSAMLPKLREAAFKMADGARADCPVGPGAGPHMINQIWHSVSNAGVIQLGCSSGHALYIEVGHYIKHGDTPRKTAPSGWVPPQPFIRPQLFKLPGYLK